MIGTHAKNRTYKYTMPRVKQPRVKAVKQPQVKQPRVKQPRVKAIKQLANVKHTSRKQSHKPEDTPHQHGLPHTLSQETHNAKHHPSQD